jgi:hypothetical protein
VLVIQGDAERVWHPAAHDRGCLALGRDLRAQDCRDRDLRRRNEPAVRVLPQCVGEGGGAVHLEVRLGGKGVPVGRVLVLVSGLVHAGRHHADLAIREPLGVEAQPRADTRERELDDHREDDRLKHLTPR